MFCGKTFKDLANESIQDNDDPENRFESKTVIEASGLLKQLQNII